MKKIIIIGSSGHAKVVIDIFLKISGYHICGLIDSFRCTGESTCGFSILGREEELPDIIRKENIEGGAVAIGDSWQRYKMAQKILDIIPDFNFISAVHPSAQIAGGVTVGQGTVVMPGAIINSESKIGDFCIINTCSIVEHDCKIADYSSIAPKASLGGGVVVGEFSAICQGADVIHKKKIGKHSIIGAGSVVLKDIPSYTVVYGNPAKEIRKRKKGEKYL